MCMNHVVVFCYQRYEFFCEFRFMEFQWINSPPHFHLMWLFACFIWLSLKYIYMYIVCCVNSWFVFFLQVICNSGTTSVAIHSCNPSPPTFHLLYMFRIQIPLTMSNVISRHTHTRLRMLVLLRTPLQLYVCSWECQAEYHFSAATQKSIASVHE